uniref:Uncharacterized protein n=1 Tax=Octopus bimaculoides TaxID=37653 RepID=A0A0L8FIY1_OCTBM
MLRLYTLLVLSECTIIPSLDFRFCNKSLSFLWCVFLLSGCLINLVFLMVVQSSCSNDQGGYRVFLVLKFLDIFSILLLGFIFCVSCLSSKYKARHLSLRMNSLVFDISSFI